ncbi:Cupredoxin, partial [Fusarium oxysporum]
MGFWKRLTEFLFISAIDKVVDVFDPDSIVGGACNTPSNRSCWSPGHDITTDYEDVVPEGVTRKFYLEVSNESIAPDGYMVDRMLFNKTYPGPTLEGNWGDTFDADGLLGAIKINGPTSMNYDVDLGPVLITDHFHKTAFSQVMLEYLGRPPPPDSFLMNGNGTYYCCPKTDSACTGRSKLTSFNFEKGKKYKMSLINTGVSTHMTFWIDNHTFSVV